MLAEVARSAGAPLPVMVLHDVGWPYGRRDLYYDPTNIPDEHRQPWQRGGMRPGQSELVGPNAGMNPALANAVAEGGPRNGVMTGVDDFVAAHDRSLRVVFLPIYFGLAIVVEEERLQRQPALAAELDRLEAPGGKDQLLRLSEDIRLEHVIFDQALLTMRDRQIDKLARRYLETVKSGILNDHHIELEAKLHHLRTVVRSGGSENEATMRDPVRNSAGRSGRCRTGIAPVSGATCSRRRRRRSGSPTTACTGRASRRRGGSGSTPSRPDSTRCGVGSSQGTWRRSASGSGAAPS